MNFHLDKLDQPIVSHFLNARRKLEVEKILTILSKLYTLSLLFNVKVTTVLYAMRCKIFYWLVAVTMRPLERLSVIRGPRIIRFRVTQIMCELSLGQKQTGPRMSSYNLIK